MYLEHEGGFIDGFDFIHVDLEPGSVGVVDERLEGLQIERVAQLVMKWQRLLLGLFRLGEQLVEEATLRRQNGPMSVNVGVTHLQHHVAKMTSTTEGVQAEEGGRDAC